jgi:hypothetical protein
MHFDSSILQDEDWMLPAKQLKPRVQALKQSIAGVS